MKLAMLGISRRGVKMFLGFVVEAVYGFGTSGGRRQALYKRESLCGEVRESVFRELTSMVYLSKDLNALLRYTRKVATTSSITASGL